VQCGKCVMVCPHGPLIRAKAGGSPPPWRNAPAGFAHAAARDTLAGQSFHPCRWAAEELHRACGLCVRSARPATGRNPLPQGDQHWNPQRPLALKQARGHWDFFLSRRTPSAGALNPGPRQFSSKCRSRCSNSPAPAPGCGKPLHQALPARLFGDRMVGGQTHGLPPRSYGRQACPPRPASSNRNGAAPPASNSLFEDNASSDSVSARLSTSAALSPPSCMRARPAFRRSAVRACWRLTSTMAGHFRATAAGRWSAAGLEANARHQRPQRPGRRLAVKRSVWL